MSSRQLAVRLFLLSVLLSSNSARASSVFSTCLSWWTISLDEPDQVGNV